MHPKHTKASPRTGERKPLTGEQRPERTVVEIHITTPAEHEVHLTMPPGPPPAAAAARLARAMSRTNAERSARGGW